MITSPQKIQAVARDLANRLAIRLQNNAGLNTVVPSADANGGQILTFSHGGNVSEGQPVAIVYLQQIPMVSTDIFGNAELAYAPSTSSLSYELTSGGAPIPAQADLDTILWELFPFGIQFNLAPIANGTAVTPAAVLASLAAPTVSLDNLYWPTKVA